MFKMYDVVQHPKFGEGQITLIEPVKGDLKITVRFMHGIIKKFYQSFAKLVKA